MMNLVWPSTEFLPGYVEALERGWSPDNLRPAAAREHLQRIANDPEGFLAMQVDRQGNGPPVVLPDGSLAPRLPGYSRWLWDGEFCGVIGFRWQPGTTALPAYCPGHIGYTVVPWKRQRGYATRALQQLLPEVRCEGLAHVDLTTLADNVASVRVIEVNGGVLIDRYSRPDVHDGAETLVYRIHLTSARAPVTEVG
jgi:predicted acetyltransferase